MKDRYSVSITAQIKASLSYCPETGDIYRGEVKVGHKHKTGYIYVWICGTKYRAHRLAWLLYHGQWPKKFIDHVNGDVSDNRIANLREASALENAYNRKPNSGTRLGVKGVYYDRAQKRYRAHIRVNGKKIQLGDSKTIEEAIEIRRKAAQELHGQFTHMSEQQNR